MAIQNFISGGFYGKLGATIGQRWKNKRTIKAYAIPHNPRTAKQQANRSLFGGFTAVAQLGQQMNYNAPCFTSESRTDWNQRMEQASLLKKANQSELNLIPVYPNGYTPAYTITNYSCTKKISDTEVQITIEGTLPTASRKLSVLVGFYNETSQNYDMELYSATTTVGDTTTFTISNTEADKFTETTHLYIVSNDDADNSNEMLFGQDLALVIDLPEEVAFDTSVKSLEVAAVTYNSDTARYVSQVTLTLNQAWVDGDQTITNVALNGISAGKNHAYTAASPTFKNNNGYFSLVIPISTTYPENVMAFPAGSSFTADSIRVDAGEKIYVASSVNEALESTDLTRKFKSTITAYSVTNGVATVTMQNNLSNQTKPAGGVSFYAVKAGQWVTQTFELSGLNSSRFTFRLSAQSGIYEEAAPSGATIAVNFTETIKGVTYEPYTTAAQSVTEGSPTRNFVLTSFEESGDDTAFVYHVPIYNAEDYYEELASGKFYKTLNVFEDSVGEDWSVSADGSDNDNIAVSIYIAQLGYYGNVAGTFKFSVTVNGVLYQSDENSYGSSDTSKTVFTINPESHTWDWSDPQIQSKELTLNATFTSVTGLTHDDFNLAFGDASFITPNWNGAYASGELADGTTFEDVNLTTSTLFVIDGSSYESTFVLEFVVEENISDESISTVSNITFPNVVTIPVQDTSITAARELHILAGEIVP